MADRIIDDADAAVDELRRKARRRLVGAIVLALGAAILIPLLFEKEPKPLGDEVSIQIPPVDDSKFVSRLSVDNRGASKGESKADSPSAGAEAGVKSDGKADAKTEAKADSKSETRSETRASTAAAQPSRAPASAGANSKGADPKRAEAKSVDAKAAEAEAVDAKAVEMKTADGKPSDATATESKQVDTNAGDTRSDGTPGGNSRNADARSVEGFVVQLAAFTDEKGANALANRLKKAGYSAYTEPVETARGTLWRVRVGGYSTRAEAKAAAAKLKAEGHHGIVASAK